MLHFAAIEGDLKTVQLLLQFEEINLNSTDRDGYTPVHCAAEFGQNAVIEVMYTGKILLYNIQSCWQRVEQL